ncbi:MAG: Gfo/Idh/MocA family oxidoreductase [Verrucomicrobia bacterium]|nr:Gfo/Idh/MocA family oxidoreductase [Verrucomicrobiota bacterium]MDA1066691.1 Gfo/Idh/MocA family oxidoreductase [Verrucomicrobiota bacterium]
MPITKIAFIGAGDISLLHAEAIDKCASAELAGIWSIDSELNADKAKRFGCTVYESVEALVADKSVDAVFILTNLESHTQYATLAMEAGKHVLIEKPVAPTISELEKLKACAEENHLILCPGHNYIHEPSLHRTKELLDSGKIGKLVAIYIHYHIHHPEIVACRYPGVIRHILTHHSYILLFLGGEMHAPESVSAMKSIVHYNEFKGEDLALVNLRLKSGALAHFCADFAADDNSSEPWTFSVKVIGTDGATSFSYRDWVENKPGVVHSHTYSVYEWHIREEVRHFVEECVQKGSKPLSTIYDAITAQKIIEGCEASITERREVSI